MVEPLLSEFTSMPSVDWLLAVLIFGASAFIVAPWLLALMPRFPVPRAETRRRLLLAAPVSLLGVALMVPAFARAIAQGDESKAAAAENARLVQEAWPGVEFNEADLECVEKVVARSQDKCESDRKVEGRPVTFIFYAQDGRLQIGWDRPTELAPLDELPQ